ncbi:cupredoxin domain-containing protein [Kutzneria albida]|uniref:Blue (type 1) copper domain-containing protein n=1 Tax=Kutzneria albida DSM 43870 TaxID=1449976 RepID=W5W7B9_9PSEU|nr:cupredoxin family copper-binding protein [Kutzneria albida]AHH96441.1 hypothetical protein KALB_3073 [Kutzneria albida DSM 43870]
MTRRTAGRAPALLLLLAPWFLVGPAHPAFAAAQQVSMAQYAFGPAALTVHAGDTITWTNQDKAPHDVTTTSAPIALHSPMLSTGQSFSYTFRQPGTYAYYCSIHPDMRAQITVLAAPTTAPPVASRAHQPASTAAPRSSSAPPMASTDSTPSAQPEPQHAAGDQPQAVAASTHATLDPMLLVAGLVAGVATLCLLLISSRAQGQA